MRPKEWRVQIGPAIPTRSGELTLIAEGGHSGLRMERRRDVRGPGSLWLTRRNARNGLDDPGARCRARDADLNAGLIASANPA